MANISYRVRGFVRCFGIVCYRHQGLLLAVLVLAILHPMFIAVLPLLHPTFGSSLGTLLCAYAVDNQSRRYIQVEYFVSAIGGCGVYVNCVEDPEISVLSANLSNAPGWLNLPRLLENWDPLRINSIPAAEVSAFGWPWVGMVDEIYLAKIGSSHQNHVWRRTGIPHKLWLGNSWMVVPLRFWVPGTVANTAVWTGSAMILVALFRWPRKGKCAWCYYCVRGLSVCPECGRDVV